MMFEAMAFKFYPIHIKHQPFNFKPKKELSSKDSSFFAPFTKNNLSSWLH